MLPFSNYGLRCMFREESLHLPVFLKYCYFSQKPALMGVQYFMHPPCTVSGTECRDDVGFILWWLFGVVREATTALALIYLQREFPKIRGTLLGVHIIRIIPKASDFEKIQKFD